MKDEMGDKASGYSWKTFILKFSYKNSISGFSRGITMPLKTVDISDWALVFWNHLLHSYYTEQMSESKRTRVIATAGGGNNNKTTV